MLLLALVYVHLVLLVLTNLKVFSPAVLLVNQVTLLPNLEHLDVSLA
jgi:hypothetical protein